MTAPSKAAIAYDFGPSVTNNGTTFRLWAPDRDSVTLLLDGRKIPMRSGGGGWFKLDCRARSGARYRFSLDDELDIPDPASTYQPDDVFGPSEVIDHDSYEWRAKDWKGRAWEEAVVLELHIGTFTQEGSFRSIIDRLDEIVDTGITAIELMPLADFAGRWNWGYDGVLLYAPDSVYGRPDDLRALIDEAHLRGLMVFLDVVYNHFGPEGNYLPQYASQFFCKAQTPWGSAIDYRIPEVREFVVQNVIHWLDRYRFDGLRFDAVHAITEAGSPPILEEIGARVSEYAKSRGRQIHLVLENDNNSAALLTSKGYRAQWNDDYHHAWHVLLTGEKEGYYKDYVSPLRHLERTLSSGFAYQGEASVHRDGRERGEPSGHLHPASFVNFIQNHDQIGNRALGDRLVTLADTAAIDAALAVTLLAPAIPLLFMGEPWGSKKPFPFFCDFHGELAEAVRSGRRAEFREAYQRFGDGVPDPLSSETFLSAKIDWEACSEPDYSRRHALVRELLAIRRTEIVPRLSGIRFDQSDRQGSLLTATWNGPTDRLRLLANLSPDRCARPQPLPAGRAIFGGTPPAELPPWSVYWSIGAA
jgi:maltooligosyltrehalose trehalohydrolase